MELNFAKLNALTFIDLTSTAEATEQPQNKANSGADNKQDTAIKNRSQGKIEGLQKLQIQIDRDKAEKERIKEVYATHQNNIKLTADLQTAILKGLKRGESVYTLFLKASKAISLMTGNTLFIDQVEADIRAIYGEGLTEEEPLQRELEETEKRLTKLKQSAERETIPTDSKARILNAIKAHETRIAELTELIGKEAENLGKCFKEN